MCFASLYIMYSCLLNYDGAPRLKIIIYGVQGIRLKIPIPFHPKLNRKKIINSAPLILTRKCYYKCSQRSNQCKIMHLYLQKIATYIYTRCCCYLCSLNPFSSGLFGTVESYMYHATATSKVALPFFKGSG